LLVNHECEMWDLSTNLLAKNKPIFIFRVGPGLSFVNSTIFNVLVLILGQRFIISELRPCERA
jgi:hypothetical protein